MITTTTNDILADFKLTASIHTITIKTSATIEEIPQEFQAAVKCRSLQKGTQTQASILLNLNKISGDVYCYSRFKELFDMFLNSVGIDEYKITRVDMRFDLFDHGSYENYAKLNRWLISMLAVKYNVYNTYKTLHLFSQKQLSVAIKNKYFECENYDKTADNHKTRYGIEYYDYKTLISAVNEIKRATTEFFDK